MPHEGVVKRGCGHNVVMTGDDMEGVVMDKELR